VSDLLFIKPGTELRQCEYSVYDIIGEQVANGLINHETTSRISLGQLDQGIYFLRLTHGDYSVTKKIIKK